MHNRMALVVFSGTADKLTVVAAMAAGAAAMEVEVELFLTFWGLRAFQRGARDSTPPAAAEYAGESQALVELFQAKNVPPWLDTLRSARELGTVTVHACSMSTELFGLALDDLEDVVDDIIGVGSFIDRAKSASISMFI